MSIKDDLVKKISEQNGNNIFIVFTEGSEWYDILPLSKKPNAGIIVLPRFHGSIATISEKEMNHLGWYKRES